MIILRQIYCLIIIKQQNYDIKWLKKIDSEKLASLLQHTF
jgi:hypothetical protein